MDIRIVDSGVRVCVCVCVCVCVYVCVLLCLLVSVCVRVQIYSDSNGCLVAYLTYADQDACGTIAVRSGMKAVFANECIRIWFLLLNVDKGYHFQGRTQKGVKGG